MACILRQKTVYRGKGEPRTEFRCWNKKCDIYRSLVTDADCDKCHFKSVRETQPCTGKEKITTIEEPECPECGKAVEEFMEKHPDGMVANFRKMSRKALKYSTALKRWIAAGRPVRSEDEVATIHEICKKCDLYDSEHGSCKGCGCRVNISKVAVVNKIKMATEHCPKDLW